MPETSIIVRTYNEEAHLPRLLKAIRGQRYKDFEIINVDSGSIDLTRSIAESYCDKLVQIKSRDFTFGYSLNSGIRVSDGRYLVCVSAHTEPLHEDWLEHLVAPLAESDTAMVYGRQVGSPELSKFSESQDFTRTFGPRRAVMRPPNFFANNANSALQRSLWDQHPFDETLTGLEDVEFAKYCMERGYEVVYEPDAPVVHIHEESWRQVRRRYFREATAAKAMGLWGRQSIPRELVRESGWFVGDILRGMRSGKVPAALGEIALFRYNKLAGTLKGLWTTSGALQAEQREKMLFDKTAKAVVIQGARHASLEDWPIPQMKPGDALIKVAYVGVCHTDLEVLDGTLGYYQRGLAAYPIVPGHEYSGRVVAVDSNVEGISKGDAVVAETVQGCGECDVCHSDNFAACNSRVEVGVFGHDGAYADYVAVPARFVHRLPEDMDLRSAALVEPLSVIMKGLRRVERVLEQPAKCCVIGAGTIGHLSALALAHKGYDVTAIEPHDGRRGLIEQLGVKVLAELPQTADFDLWIEATGNAEVLESTLEGSHADATLLLLGLPYGPAQFNFECIVTDDKTVVGSVGAAGRDVEAAIDALPLLNTAALTANVTPLASYKEAWDAVRNRTHLKQLLEVDSLLNQGHDPEKLKDIRRG